MWLRVCVAALALCACGIELTGGAVPMEADGGPRSDGAAAAAAPDAGSAEGGPSDAGKPLPDPARVTVSYAVGKDAVVYAFDRTTRVFTAQNSAGCPSGEETAVFSDGSVYITSVTGLDLYRWTAAVGCTSIRKGVRYPFALGVAPKGTVSATAEVMVGYVNGDYVRVDTATGDVVPITPGALSDLRPSGDVTAVGQKGYLAAAANTGSGAFACGGGSDCVVEVDLTTGRPIKLLKALPGVPIYGLAHALGNLLLYTPSQVYEFDLSTNTLGPSLASTPFAADFGGAGAAPYPEPW